MSDFSPSMLSPLSGGIFLSPYSTGQPIGEIARSARAFPSGVGAWPVANRAYFMPIIIDKPIELMQMAMYNGAVAGEVDVGVYSYPGTGTSARRLVSNGKVAMSGASQPQVFNIADTVLTPGVYLFAGVCSTVTTATFQRSTLPSMWLQACGVAQMSSALPLPETVTIARMETNFAPAIVGVCKSLAL